VYGKGVDQTPEFWYSLIRQISVQGFLEKDIDNFGVIRISDKGRKYLADPYKVVIKQDHDFTVADSDDDDDTSREGGGTKGGDPVLFEMLVALTKKVAASKGLPAYTIFQEPSLQEMSILYPVNESELAQIVVVGQGKVMKFGKPFLEMINAYVKENDITPAGDVVVKSAVQKGKKKISIIQLIDRKVDLEEIADQTNLSFGELLDELEHIVYSGTKLNLNYYIAQVIDEDRQDELFDYFMGSKTDELEAAVYEFGLDYTEDEIRLMRVKFISEVAN
jgi:ATP-dependent DNA helicase RecQ